jgi:hypothetical protein
MQFNQLLQTLLNNLFNLQFIQQLQIKVNGLDIQ